MPQRKTMLEGFLLDFSGFRSPAWADLFEDTRNRAADSYTFLQMSDYELDREDYLKIFAETIDQAKQHAEVARALCEIFAIRLALKLGIPNGILFARYDAEPDRIVATVPLAMVKRILDFCGEKRHRPLEGLKRSDFEPLYEYIPELGDQPNEAAAGCLRMLDHSAVGAVLRAFGNPGIEKKAIAEIAGKRSMVAFTNAIDGTRFRAATAARRREKYSSGKDRRLN